MRFERAYCGLILMRLEIGHYACIDKYTSEIKVSGSYDKCNSYFKEYVNQVANRR